MMVVVVVLGMGSGTEVVFRVFKCMFLLKQFSVRTVCVQTFVRNYLRMPPKGK